MIVMPCCRSDLTSMLTHCNTHTYATHVYTRAEAVGLLSTMPGMEHVDLGCVHENIEHIIAEHGTDGELDLEQFKTAVHEAEDPVGPCFHE